MGKRGPRWHLHLSPASASGKLVIGPRRRRSPSPSAACSSPPCSSASSRTRWVITWMTSRREKRRPRNEPHSSIRMERQNAPIVEQVSNANESEGGGVIVILAEMEKERQEELIAEFEYESLGTWRDL